MSLKKVLLGAAFIKSYHFPLTFSKSFQMLGLSAPIFFGKFNPILDACEENFGLKDIGVKRGHRTNGIGSLLSNWVFKNGRNYGQSVAGCFKGFRIECTRMLQHVIEFSMRFNNMLESSRNFGNV